MSATIVARLQVDPDDADGVVALLEDLAQDTAIESMSVMPATVTAAHDDALGAAIDALSYALENDAEYLPTDTIAAWTAALEVLNS